MCTDCLGNRIERPAKFGGDLEFHRYDELERAFAEGKLHPADAKSGTRRAEEN